MKLKYLLPLLILPVALAAQGAGTGTPSQLRVMTDSTGALYAAAVTQTLPLSQPTVFSNTRVKTDATGALVVVVSGGGTTPTFTNATISNAIAATSTDGLILINPTDASNGAQQWSPRIRWHGAGFKSNATSESQTYDYILELQTAQGTALSEGALVLSLSFKGGAYAAIQQFDINGIRLLTTGGITATGSNGSTMGFGTPGTLSFGMVDSAGVNRFGLLPTNFIAWYDNGGGNIMGSNYDVRLDRTAAGELGITGAAGTQNVGAHYLYVTEAVTVSKSPSILENNELYTNTGDGDGTVFTLPNDPPVGSVYHFSATVAQAMVISPAAGESIRSDGSTCVDIRIGAAIGESLTLVAAVGGSGGMWVPESNFGGLTCTP